MKLDFGPLKGRVNRRIRRTALPSTLIGLVAFSFTLVVFSAAVYTSSLPALVMARSGVSDDGLFGAIAHAMFGDAGADASSGEASDSSANDASPETGANGGAGASHASFTLGGLSINSILGSIDSPSKPEEGAPGDQQDSNGGHGGNDGAGGNGGNSGGDQGPGIDSEVPERPDNPEGPTPEEEQAIYEFLLAKAQAVDGYIAEVNACVDAFNNDKFADKSTRLAHKATCDSLSMRIFDDFNQTLNNPSIPNASKYKPAQGDLIGMLRCLLSYLGTIQEAWEINVGFDDPAAHVNKFMAPVIRDTVNGQNKHLTEFYTYYDGFVL